MKLRDAHWSVYFIAWFAGVSALGALVGAVAFVAGGALVQESPSYLALAREGARRVGFIFSIWGPAIGIAACVMRAYRRKQAADEAATESATPAATKTADLASTAKSSEPGVQGH